jgi:hypothetical protein
MLNSIVSLVTMSRIRVQVVAGGRVAPAAAGDGDGDAPGLGDAAGDAAVAGEAAGLDAAVGTEVGAGVEEDAQAARSRLASRVMRMSTRRTTGNPSRISFGKSTTVADPLQPRTSLLSGAREVRYPSRIALSRWDRAAQRAGFVPATR